MIGSTETTANGETPIPRAVGEALRRVHGLDARPESLTEWGTAIGEMSNQFDIEVGLETLCTTEDSPHRARFDETTQHFVCVQDAFIVPAVVTDVETVEITTESPVSGAKIDVVVSGGEVEVDPSGAVMSIGVAADAEGPSPDADRRELAYEKICPYGHAFRDQSEYEAWADTVDAETMVAPLESAIELAHAIEAAVPDP